MEAPAAAAATVTALALHTGAPLPAAPVWDRAWDAAWALIDNGRTHAATAQATATGHAAPPPCSPQVA